MLYVQKSNSKRVETLRYACHSIAEAEHIVFFLK